MRDCFRNPAGDHRTVLSPARCDGDRDLIALSRRYRHHGGIGWNPLRARGDASPRASSPWELVCRAKVGPPCVVGPKTGGDSPDTPAIRAGDEPGVQPVGNLEAGKDAARLRLALHRDADLRLTRLGGNASDVERHRQVSVRRVRGNRHVELALTGEDQEARVAGYLRGDAADRMLTVPASVGNGGFTTWPAGNDGIVGPHPVPNRSTVSPGLAGRVVSPGSSPGGAM